MKLIKILILLSILGIILSSYSLYHHYSKTEGFCNLNEKLSCDIVNRSEYSELFNIPVALLGIIGYLAILISSLIYKKEKTKEIKYLILIMSLIGFLFTIYLTYIEAFILYTFCPLCILSAILITAIFIINIIIIKTYKHPVA